MNFETALGDSSRKFEFGTASEQKKNMNQMKNFEVLNMYWVLKPVENCIIYGLSNQLLNGIRQLLLFTV